MVNNAEVFFFGETQHEVEEHWKSHHETHEEQEHALFCGHFIDKRNTVGSIELVIDRTLFLPNQTKLFFCQL